jgi:hypothetical protein
MKTLLPLNLIKDEVNTAYLDSEVILNLVIPSFDWDLQNSKIVKIVYFGDGRKCKN